MGMAQIDQPSANQHTNAEVSHTEMLAPDGAVCGDTSKWPCSREQDNSVIIQHHFFGGTAPYLHIKTKSFNTGYD